MFKLIYILTFFLLTLFFPIKIFAQSNSFISVVNPIRGEDFKELKNQKVEEAVLGEIGILDKYKLPATWLIRYDAFSNKQIVDQLNKRADEKGLFLEITPTWTQDASVSYHQSSSWHSAASAFLSGYELGDREKLIDKAFEKFKSTFGNYPKTVGAWWVDAHSANYMQEKYDIDSVLIVSDQYTTDNYQIWGQYWSTPYYPAKNHLLHPAQSLINKIPIVITQWAARDPVNAYGSGVEESTLSVQPNDYIDYHNLNTDYFEKLVDIYTKQKLNKFSHLVVGLENSYDWQKYKGEYENQIKVLFKKKEAGELSIVTVGEFANWYKKTFPQLSPAQIIVADDPLGSFKKVVWFMNPYFRAGWFLNSDGSTFRDVRQYVDGEEELCFKTKCDSVNFATFATRVLDEVSFGHKLVIDQGKIKDFNISKSGENFTITYKNEGGNERRIEFLPRDIKIDDKTLSIDALILEATKNQLEQKSTKIELEKGSFKWSFISVVFKTLKFLLFLFIGCLIPGFLLINKILDKENPSFQKAILGTTVGFVVLTLIFYLLNLLHLKQLIFIYLFINLILAVKNYKLILNFKLPKLKYGVNLLILGLIFSGTVFQQLPTFKNGLTYPYGIGFWGPNTHDGVWHISLINQLTKSTPPQNPIFASETLKNYHYFYDLLIAAVNYITNIPVVDLVFRLFPLIFSLFLGIGTYYLIKTLFKERLSSLQIKLASAFALYLVYFAGSFGWIVEYIKFKHLGGESAFWANQSISFNLNPPFAVSLIIIISILQFLPVLKKFNILSILTVSLLVGSLISFKAYGGVLIIFTFLLISIIKRSVSYFVTFLMSSILSAILFLSNFSLGERLFLFSPFWFIHSMIDSPDRVGWIRLSLMRMVGLETKNWFKFVLSETVSLLIFLIGNLGARFLALFALFKMKSIFQKDEKFLFLFIFSLLSFLIPLLFIQAGNPWNTIQFIYYLLYVSSVIGGVIIFHILKKYKIIGAIFVLALLIITPINSWATANGYLTYQPHAHITKLEWEGLEFLRNQSDGVVLTFPYDDKLKQRYKEPWPISVYDSTAYVSAFTQKGVFIEDIPQNQILLTDYKKRLVSSNDFFRIQGYKEKEFLKSNQIKYVYIPKVFNIKLNEETLGVKNIFENSEVVIYKVEEK